MKKEEVLSSMNLGLKCRVLDLAQKKGEIYTGDGFLYMQILHNIENYTNKISLETILEIKSGEDAKKFCKTGKGEFMDILYSPDL